jgi:peptidoglycan/LPS O-acetylase OafA/YrhL
MLALFSTPFLPALTGIRALAALYVLGMHAQLLSTSGIATYLPFLWRGYLGVDFFFLLSGFIITHVYLASLGRPDREAIVIFLWHRIIRLCPVHITVLAALLPIVYVAGASGMSFNSPHNWRATDLLWQLTLTHGWGTMNALGWNPPSWSISAEWFAYLLFPLLALGLQQLRSAVTSISLAIVALAATAAIFAVTNWTFTGSDVIGAPALARVSGEFLCGALLRRALDGRMTALSPVWIGDAAGAAAFVLFLVGATREWPDFLLVALAAITIVGAATAQSFFAGILGSRPMVWLGEISYSIYMVHFPIFVILRRVLDLASFQPSNPTGDLLVFAGALGLVIGCATILFYCVERPMRARLRDSLGVLSSANVAPASSPGPR